MTKRPLDVRLTGASVLIDGTLQTSPVAMQGGYISATAPFSVDLSGYYVLPGIIDLHGDAFERHISPRPSAPFPLRQGLIATDRDAAANGVTTAWLAQSWSWEGGRRGPDFATELLQALDDYGPDMQTDLRVQLRCETHTVDTAEQLLKTIRTHKIGYVVFNNHLEESLLLACARPEEITLWAKAAGRTPDQHMAIVREAKKQAPQVPRYLCQLAAEFDRLGVIYGSHDDPDAETRETFSMIGAKICEFPTAMAAAKLARAVDDPVIMGAPNVVRGGSQAGNISASALIESGYCNVLVSDYHYPSLARAAFTLADQEVLSLPRAWAMISETPARIMKLKDRGTIDYGTRADLAIVNMATREVEATFTAGRITYLAGEAATRFLAGAEALRLAAE